MCTGSLRIFAMVVVVLFAFTSAEADDGLLRVMTYNIHHGRGLDGKIDLRRIADVIKDAQPDLVALQEVDFKTRRSGGVDQSAVLGELCSMHAIFGRASDYQGGQYGNAVLSSRPFLSTKNHRLPKGGAENRASIAATVQLHKRQAVTFASTHFDHINAKARTDAAELLAGLVPASSSLVILAGDLNCSPDAAELHPLLQVFRSVNAEPIATFPGRSPTSQIDYILYDRRARWTVESCEVIDDNGASDHRPILAVIRVRR
ncbi:MAG: endonuclease [Planctomycetaceae bacterium]|nr:MAG: endonuclease [Planctomycetaceae bacterium]